VSGAIESFIETVLLSLLTGKEVDFAEIILLHELLGGYLSPAMAHGMQILVALLLMANRFLRQRC